MDIESDKYKNFTSDEKLKSIIEKVMGNSDSLLIEAIKGTVIKIEKMEDGTKTTIYDLVDEHNKFTSQQLFEIYKVVNEVCSKLNIDLDQSAHKNQVIGLPYNISFIKRTKK